MTLRPNYLRAVVVVYICVSAMVALTLITDLIRDAPVRINELLGMAAIGGTFMAAAVSVMFVPREIQYDSEEFSCRMIIQGSHTFSWLDLEGYGTGNNVFLIKFKGHQAMQISSFGFRRAEWKAFTKFIRTTFPNRKCSIWLGPKPIMRKNK